MTEEPEAPELVRGLREGRADAWQAFYDAYAGRVWRAVARLIGPSSADVADVVQETFLAAARAVSGYDADRGALWPWLWGIGRRHVALHYRKRERQERIRAVAEWQAAHAGPVARALNGEETPPDVLEAAELAELVRATLVELPEDYETLLTAMYLDRIPVEQMARRVGSTPTAVRSKLARAREAFRKVFLRFSEPSPEPTARGRHESRVR